MSKHSQSAQDSQAVTATQCGSRRQVGVSLDALFTESRQAPGVPVSARSCTCDWTQVKAGDVFVALDDGQNDGHESAREAVAAGAIAVVCERGVPVFNVPVFLVEDSRQAYGELCQALAGSPSHRLRVIAVSGAQGKSTTLELLNSIFTAAGKEVGLLSSFATCDGMSRSAGVSEAPTPATLAKRLANMDAAGCTHALVEVSSVMLAQGLLAGIQLDTACVTRITSAHLEHHQNCQRYRDAEHRVLEYLSADGVTVLNADDPESCRLLSEAPGASFVYGLGAESLGEGMIAAEVISQDANEQVFLLSVGRESVVVRSTVVGEHHLQNCLAAATTALAQGISLEHIARGLESVATLPGMMQRVDCGQDYPVYLDAANSSDSLVATLKAARQIASGRVICVLGDVASTDINENTLIQNVVCKKADLAVVTETLALRTPDWPTRRTSGGEVQVALDRKEAIGWAIAAAQPGDVVVIAGAKPSSSAAFGQSEEQTDMDVARELLYARSLVPAFGLVG